MDLNSEKWIFGMKIHIDQPNTWIKKRKAGIQNSLFLMMLVLPIGLYFSTQGGQYLVVVALLVLLTIVMLVSILIN